jgi:hypothetical protein
VLSETGNFPTDLYIIQVRKTPGRPRSGPTSAFYSCVTIGVHGPTGIFWADLTPFSLQGMLDLLGGRSPGRSSHSDVA